VAKLTRTEQMRAKNLKRGAMHQRRSAKLDRAEIDVWLALTASADAKNRCDAVLHLCPCHIQGEAPEVWNRLFAMVTDPDVKVRSNLLHVLADGSPKAREGEVLQALESLHNEPDLKLRRRVRQLLAQYRRTGNINVL
jgi:hypothetical protein